MGLKRLLLIASLVATALLGVGVCLAPAQVPGPSAQSSKTTTGTMTSNVCPGTGCVTLEVTGYAGASIQLSGVWSAGIFVEASLDGVQYSPISVTSSLGTYQGFGPGQNDVYMVFIAGLHDLRVRVQSYTSGTVTVTITAVASGAPFAPNLTIPLVELGGFPSNWVPVVGFSDLAGTQTVLPKVDANGALTVMEQPGGLLAPDTTAVFSGNIWRPFMPAVASSSAPTLTDQNINPLFMDLAGNLRVSCLVGCTGGTPGQATMAASSPVVIASDQSAVHTVCDSGCGSPPATADGTAFSFGTTNVSPVAFVVDDVASTTVAENAYGIARMTPNRIQYVDLSKSGSNTSSFKVDFGGSAQPVSFTMPALVAGAAIIGNVRIDQTTPGTTNGVQVNAALPAGANVIGHVIVDTTSTTTVTQATGTNLHAVLDSGTLTTVTAVTGITNALPAGTNVIGHVIADSGSTTAVTSLPAITGTVTANAGSNLNTSLLALESTQILQATATKQDTGNTSLGTIKTNTDPLVTAGAGGYIRQDSTATIAKESGGNLATIVTNTTNIATAARQDTGNTSVGSIDTKTPALGQALAASSVPVVLTAIQVAALTPPTNTGYALDSSLTTLNAKDFATQTTLAAELAMLTTLTAKIIQNQQTMANSLSVTLAVDQPPILTRTNPLLNTLPCNALRRTNCSPKGF